MADLETLRPKESKLGKVLIVDDDPIQLRIREAVLRGADFEVCIATSAESALATLRAEYLGDSINVVITDHFMPKIGGVEFVRRLREINPTMPILVVSGQPDVEPEYDGLNVTFRQKPCPPRELISLVRSSIQKAA